ncbi:outer membrane transport energization protein ExbD [Luteibacter rhizovicinus]|uniref:Outer membrane transport energization protein ExbD n=1 Tax=Luteibacter rhizovicinus TaxID=242606 RepID=A0A4R3YWN1_9GAMM|nr:biopolymer transporter ExbD [Luteibacter rhizovicinus]TCV97081.1 outer membrane transport energization protein ExbD [Luteibacter rhizovicinus]
MAFSARVDNAPISGINVTPLVDVLLVLLIIFMISAPVIAHKATVDLPQASQQAKLPTVEPIHLAIEGDGVLYWNDTPISEAQLDTQLTIAAAQAEQPALQIDATDSVAYETVARVLTDAKAHGMGKIDFIGRD